MSPRVLRLHRVVSALLITMLAALLVACGQQAPASPQAAAAPTQPVAAPTKAPAAQAQPTPVPAAPAPAQSAPAQPFRLGVLLPLTGNYGVYGVDVINGVNFAVEEINKAGGVKGLGGAKIELIVADTVADTKIALTEFERLASKEKVDAIFGPFSSVEITQLAPLGDKYKIPVITVGGQADEMYKLDVRWAVHIGPAGPPLGTGLMNIVLDMVEEFKLPSERIVYFAPDSEATKWPNEAAKKVAEQRGYGKNFAGEVFAPYNSTDLTSYALKLKSMKPDILIANDSAAFASLMVRAMDAVEFKPPVWGDTTAIADPKMRQAVGDALWTKVVRRAGVVYFDWDHTDLPIKGVQDFKARISPWLKEKNQMYTPRVAYAQAIYALARVLDQVKTKDKVAVNDGLHKVSIPETDPQFVAAQFAPALEWKANGEPKNLRLLGLQTQLVGGAEKSQLVYPKSVRPAGVTVSAK